MAKGRVPGGPATQMRVPGRAGAVPWPGKWDTDSPQLCYNYHHSSARFAVEQTTSAAEDVQAEEPPKKKVRVIDDHA